MALQHAASGDKIALARDDGDIAFFTSVALAKTPNMELIRLVLPKERPMPDRRGRHDRSVSKGSRRQHDRAPRSPAAGRRRTARRPPHW
jgi:hypothetical protein